MKKHDALFIALRGWILAELRLHKNQTTEQYELTAGRCHEVVKKLMEAANV
jgi:hypothetical protein